jgi:hypothetical protein
MKTFNELADDVLEGAKKYFAAHTAFTTDRRTKFEAEALRDAKTEFRETLGAAIDARLNARGRNA